jgi:hypothetical protein
MIIIEKEADPAGSPPFMFLISRGLDLAGLTKRILLFNKDLVPNHKHKNSPDFPAVVCFALAMVIEQVQYILLIE